MYKISLGVCYMYVIWQNKGSSEMSALFLHFLLEVDDAELAFAIERQPLRGSELIYYQRRTDIVYMYLHCIQTKSKPFRSRKCISLCNNSG